jgi:hypothetical protein
MRRSRLVRAAGVTAATVVVGALVGAQPAHADITVDSAVCISNASGTLTPPNPVIAPHPDFLVYARVFWQTTTDNMYCRQANGWLVLVRGGKEGNRIALGSGNGKLFDPGTYTLRLHTSLGSKDLAAVTVT